MTMTLVSTVQVGAGGAASIDFTSIPQTGTDLVIVFSAKSDTASTLGTNLNIQFNGDTAANYTQIHLRGNGTSVVSATTPIGYVAANGQTASTFGNGSVYIANYTGSTAKSYSADTVTENNATSANLSIGAGKWSGTAAITSMTLFPSSSNFLQYSTASLYTIKKGSGGATVA